MMVVLCYLLFFSPELSGQPRPAKKIVEYGWDVPYPDFVRDHIRQMEQRPFEGIIFRTRGFDHAFEVQPWSKEKLQEQLDVLGQIQWVRFTDNFLILYAASQWGMDWFSDEHWRIIEENLKLFSLAVQTGHCVGVCFDPEPYGTDPWVYPGSYSDKSFEEVCAKVRQRGKQFIRALQTHRPEMKWLSFFQFGLYDSILDEPDAKVRQEKLRQTTWMVLLPSFLLGVLEGAEPNTILIDGNETAYYYEDSEPYYRAYHTIHQRALSMVPEDLRAKYRCQVQAGAALYIDQVTGVRPDDVLSHYMPAEDQLRFFEHNVYYALTTADEYVWCYSERMNWWLPPEEAGDRKLPEGVEAALRSARQKYNAGQPLGFDIQHIVETAREKQRNSGDKK